MALRNLGLLVETHWSVICRFGADDFVVWAAHLTVFSVACNSDSEILAALQTVANTVVVRTQRHRLNTDKFPMFSVGWRGKDFVAIWIPVGLSSGLAP